MRARDIKIGDRIYNGQRVEEVRRIEAAVPAEKGHDAVLGGPGIIKVWTNYSAPARPLRFKPHDPVRTPEELDREQQPETVTITTNSPAVEALARTMDLPVEVVAEAEVAWPNPTMAPPSAPFSAAECEAISEANRARVPDGRHPEEVADAKWMADPHNNRTVAKDWPARCPRCDSDEPMAEPPDGCAHVWHVLPREISTRATGFRVNVRRKPYLSAGYLGGAPMLYTKDTEGKRIILAPFLSHEAFLVFLQAMGVR